MLSTPAPTATSEHVSILSDADTPAPDHNIEPSSSEQPNLIKARRFERGQGEAGDDISILSWNILADCYAQENMRFYMHAHDYLAWALRRPVILSTIQTFNADIVCLQVTTLV